MGPIDSWAIRSWAMPGINSVGTHALLQVAVDEVVVVLVGDGSVPAEPIAGGDELARRNAVRSPCAIRIVLADRIPTYVARLEATNRFGLWWQRRLATDRPDHRVAIIQRHPRQRLVLDAQQSRPVHRVERQQEVTHAPVLAA